MQIIRCTICGYENPSTGRFCSKCGRAIAIQCKVCGEDVPHDSKFCGKCGSEITATIAGLFLDHALAWKQQFQSIGWWEAPDVRCMPLLRQLIEQGQIPMMDSPHEPWILVCNGSLAPWKPYFLVDTKRGLASDPDMCILATRCRLLTIALKQRPSMKGALRKALLEITTRIDNIPSILWYKDITNVDWKHKGNWYRFSLITKTGDEVAIGINTEGSRFIDVVTALAASDPVSRNWARFGIQVKAGQRLGFIDFISAFVKEISEVRE